MYFVEREELFEIQTLNLYCIEFAKRAFAQLHTIHRRRHTSSQTKQNKNMQMTTVNAPQWVNRERFTGLLKQNYTEFENIEKFECTAAISGGENYLTIVLRIGIEMLMKGGSATRSYMFLHVCVCVHECWEKESMQVYRTLYQQIRAAKR